MGLFNSIFGSNKDGESKPEEASPWVMLTTMEQLDEIAEKSASRTQVIFKHSTTCGISRMVLNGFERNPVFREKRVDFYFLDLHRYRDISNGIAQKFEVYHQSPQLLVIRNGQTVAHDSHGGVNEVALEKYV
ncbi:MAG: bacillithiol system redox-active protein YtxJ [Pricia sp.]